MQTNSTGAAPLAVVIRNLNEGTSLQKVLRALRAQNSPPAEIIVVDNESTDNSLAIARQYGAEVVVVPRKKFTYGRALNIGIRRASQPFVLNLSAHSVPLGCSFVDELLAPFKDPAVGAVSCRNVSIKEDAADWPTARRLSGNVDWQTLFNQGLVNSAAAIRRDLWLKIPYDESLPFSEDALWARKVLAAGYEIAASAATYVYLREYKFWETVRRRDSEGLAVFRISGLRPSYGARRIARAVFVNSLRAALRVIAYESLLALSKLTYSLRAGNDAREVPASTLELLDKQNSGDVKTDVPARTRTEELAY